MDLQKRNFMKYFVLILTLTFASLSYGAQANDVALLLATMEPTQADATSTVPQSAALTPRTNRQKRKSSQARVAKKNAYIKSLSAAKNHFFPVVGGIKGDTGKAAKRFMRKHRHAFGMGSNHGDLVIKRKQTKKRHEFVRLKQTYQNLPVFGAEVIVQINSEGVTYVQSDVMRDTWHLDSGAVLLSPTISGSQAKQLALDQVGKTYQTPEVITKKPTLMIYHPSTIGNSGATTLVWKFVVSGGTSQAISELVLINAHDGAITLQFSNIHHILDRQVYNNNNSTNTPATPTRSEGQGPTNVADVDLLYDLIGTVYDFYYNLHGRDGYDNQGATVVASANYCSSNHGPCPTQNAFWDPEVKKMFFGQGMVTDDIVGHEYTHAVISADSNLLYKNESGAINEALCDIWGEFIDQTNYSAGDSEETRWQLGENCAIGAIRNMQDPTLYNQPAYKNDEFWHYGSSDSGGVHINSGVINKLCYLLTDGDTFNGYYVYGMGFENVATLFYETQTNLLTTASDFHDLFEALVAATNNLQWDTAAQKNVVQACLAVKLSDTSPNNNFCGNAIPLIDGVVEIGTTANASGTINSSCALADTVYGDDPNALTDPNDNGFHLFEAYGDDDTFYGIHDPNDPNTQDDPNNIDDPYDLPPPSLATEALDVWYSYTPAVGDNVTISLCGSEMSTTLSIYDDCGGNEIACNNNYCGQQSEITMWMAQDTTYYIRVASTHVEGVFNILATGGLGMGDQPDLAPFQVNDWDDVIVISTESDSFISSPLITTSNTLYVNFSCFNGGKASADPFLYGIYIDNIPALIIDSTTTLDVNAGIFELNTPIGPLTAGNHILEVRCDINNDVAESDETNNNYIMPIQVAVCEAPQTDTNDDCIVNSLDLFTMAEEWLSNIAIDDGLMGHWSFDIVPGQNTTDPNFPGWNTCLDVSGNNNHGFVHEATYQTGVLGTALSFDGINDFVKIPTSTTLDNATNTMSISTWIYLHTNNDGTGNEILSKHASASRTWRLKMDEYNSLPNNNFTFTDSNGISDHYTCNSLTEIDPNQWQHIAIVDDQGDIELYIDGDLVNNTSSGFGIPPTINSDLYIGSFLGFHNFFTGMIDELRIYDRVLTYNEIQYLSKGLNTDFSNNNIVNFSDIGVFSTEWQTDGLVIP